MILFVDHDAAVDPGLITQLLRSSEKQLIEDEGVFDFVMIFVPGRPTRAPEPEPGTDEWEDCFAALASIQRASGLLQELDGPPRHVS